MKDINNYIGQTFGNLTVVSVDNDSIGKTYNSCHWIFLCDCGNTISEVPCKVLNGHKKSCGCRKKKRLLKHGHYNDRFYHTWWSMMQRCYNPEHHNYKNYGARGIEVCEEWKNVHNFIEWAHATYPQTNQKLSLDRINSNSSYIPENCRWTSQKAQVNNRRNTTMCEMNGVTKSLSEWCAEYQMPLSVVSSRIRVMGWPVEKALTTPTKSKSSR